MCPKVVTEKKFSVWKTMIDTSYSIESDNFIFRVAEHSAKVFQIKYYGKEVLLLCPANTCYNEEKVQQWLRKAVTTAITRRAKAFLPVRLKQLATEKGFTYNNCTIRNVHSRWGSCSTRGNISLSIYLMLLPDKLMDYVLLHELCHTVEMNHSEKFWALMDRTVAPAKAKDLRKMLKAHKTNF